MFRRTFSSALVFSTMSAFTGHAFAFDAPELSILREKFSASVPSQYQVALTPEMQAAQDAAIRSYPEVQALMAPEFLVVVNRHAKVQSMSVVLTDGKIIHYVGSAKVSTGDLNRKKYFATPIGLFENKREYGNYRAQGTKNENGIRGFGRKGMRVFDFGWQDSVASWGARSPASIRLLIHATDPDVLEARLGATASQGCVRIQTGVNVFLDEYGVLDKNYLATDTTAAGWVLSKTKKFNKYDGRFMIVMEQAPTAMVAPTMQAPSLAPTAAPTTLPMGTAPTPSIGTTPSVVR